MGEGSRAQGRIPRDSAEPRSRDAPVGLATPPTPALRQLNRPGALSCGQREDGTVNNQRLCSGFLGFNHSLRFLVCIPPVIDPWKKKLQTPAEPCRNVS